jgi:hypothetical protein
LSHGRLAGGSFFLSWGRRCFSTAWWLVDTPLAANQCLSTFLFLGFGRTDCWKAGNGRDGWVGLVTVGIIALWDLLSSGGFELSCARSLGALGCGAGYYRWTSGILGVGGIDGWDVVVGIIALWDLLSSGGLELSSARSLVCSRWWGGILQLLD